MSDEIDQETQTEPQDEANQTTSQKHTAVGHLPQRIVWRYSVGYALATMFVGIGFAFFGFTTHISYAITTLAVGVGFLIWTIIYHYLQARHADGVIPRERNWGMVRLRILQILVSITALSVLIAFAIFLFKASYKIGEASVPDSLTKVSPPTSSPNPSVDPVTRILENGRIVVEVAPEYFEDLVKSDEYTTLQRAQIRDSYLGKWIMFAGTLNDVLPGRNNELFVSIKRPKSQQHVWFKDPAQQDAIRRLRKNDPLTVLCVIASVPRSPELMTYALCEVVK